LKKNYPHLYMIEETQLQQQHDCDRFLAVI